ncbi:Uncharacterised protein [Mycobacteroides abscessus]|nr:Uncharacterised protein [Mycobacteroides abscessus]
MASTEGSEVPVDSAVIVDGRQCQTRELGVFEHLAVVHLWRKCLLSASHKRHLPRAALGIETHTGIECGRGDHRRSQQLGLREVVIQLALAEEQSIEDGVIIEFVAIGVGEGVVGRSEIDRRIRHAVCVLHRHLVGLGSVQQVPTSQQLVTLHPGTFDDAYRERVVVAALGLSAPHERLRKRPERHLDVLGEPATVVGVLPDGSERLIGECPEHLGLIGAGHRHDRRSGCQ